MLPSGEFTYGKPDQLNQEGAAQVCTSWKIHKSNITDDSKNPRNFKTLNKRAVI
tara:strand:+ start:169 stop:330 length:162 start_codon:yes stop_codon:yes gene_type:complete